MRRRQHDPACARDSRSAVGPGGFIKEFDGWTNNFIFPPYDFTVADAFVVNFQMPLTTMLMLVTAFGGYDVVMNAYKEVLKGDYMFGTFGDAMLIID